MSQIEKVSGFESGFELSVLYSYPMSSAFAFVSGLKCGKMWHSDPISSVSDSNPSLPPAELPPFRVSVKPDEYSLHLSLQKTHTTISEFIPNRIHTEFDKVYIKIIMIFLYRLGFNQIE